MSWGGPVLLARVVEPSTKAGWVVEYAEGRFTMDLHEQIEPARIMAMDAKGYLEWTHAAVRRWVRSLVAEPRSGVGERERPAVADRSGEAGRPRPRAARPW